MIAKIQVSWNIFEFRFRKRLFGFNNANGFLRRVDRNSLVPILIKHGAKIGENCDIEAPLFFHNCTDFSNLTIGNNCHIGKNCFFDLRDTITLAENIVVSMQCTFITHQDMNKSEMRTLFPATHAPVSIGRNTYIGVNSTILQGITLAENCLVAAGSVVTKDVEANSVVAGVPAKFKKKLPAF